jgi:hypothetical protein
MSHKKTFQPLLSPVVELLREYSLTFEEKKKVDEAIKLFHDNKGDGLNDTKKDVFNELFLNFNDEQVLLFVDKFNYVSFLKYLTPKNFLKTYLMKNSIIESILRKNNEKTAEELKELKTLLEIFFTNRLLKFKKYYEEHRLEDKEFAFITKYLDENNTIPLVKKTYIIPSTNIPPPFSDNPFSKKSHVNKNFTRNNEESLLSKKNKSVTEDNSSVNLLLHNDNFNKQKVILTKRIKDVKPKLYYCILPPNKNTSCPYKVTNNNNKHFEKLLLCEKNPVNNIVDMTKTKDSIITGGKNHTIKTLNKRIVNKRKSSSKYLKMSGDCFCNKKGGFMVFGNRSSRSINHLKSNKSYKNYNNSKNKFKYVNKTLITGGSALMSNSMPTLNSMAGDKLYV